MPRTKILLRANLENYLQNINTHALVYEFSLVSILILSRTEGVHERERRRESERDGRGREKIEGSTNLSNAVSHNMW